MEDSRSDAPRPGRHPSSDEASGRLRRDLGLADAVAIGLGAIVGGGIFVITGLAAEIAGPGLLAGLLIAAFAATCNALSSAQLAASYPKSGGAYEYGYLLIGPRTGFAAGWLFLVSKITAAGTVAIGLSGYLEALVPGFPARPVAVAAVLAFTLVNVAGIRRSSGVNMVIVALSTGSLLLFVITGVGAADPDNLLPLMPTGIRGVLQAAALLFFAYTGYARIATLAEEVRDPETTIPRAIVTTLFLAVCLYLAVAAVALAAVGSAEFAASPAPLHSVALRISGPTVAAAVAVGGVSAMLGVILSQLLGLSRVVFAMARRGDLPRALGAVHPGSGVPHRAVVAVGMLAAILAATGSLEDIAASASFAILIYYLVANIAALRMPADRKIVPNAVPVCGAIACIVLATALPPRTIVIGLLILGAGLAGREVLRRGNPDDRSEIART